MKLFPAHFIMALHHMDVVSFSAPGLLHLFSFQFYFLVLFEQQMRELCTVDKFRFAECRYQADKLRSVRDKPGLKEMAAPWLWDHSFLRRQCVAYIYDRIKVICCVLLLFGFSSSLPPCHYMFFCRKLTLRPLPMIPFFGEHVKGTDE